MTRRELSIERQLKWFGKKDEASFEGEGERANGHGEYGGHVCIMCIRVIV